jgi:serine/threonine protein kinase
MSTQPTANNPSDPARQNDPSAETLAFHQPSPAPTPTAAAAPQEGDSKPAEPVSLVGQSFDDVELLQELGRGGMGLVYKARQKSLDRLVAVKLLLADQLAEPTRVARFQAEARAAASLDHPNIVQIYQVGQCPFGHYFTMEFIDGHSLEYYIEKKKVPLQAAVNLIIAVGQALHYAHGKGIVHRDLKPANIMMDRGQRPVITDFGIVKFMGRSSSLTQEGTIMGTPAFMAPEQTGDAADQVGPWSDVYALGAILYTMLSGRVPYDEGAPLRTILKVISPEMPPSIRSVRPEVPEALEEICMKCLSKMPADRYPSAELLAEDLRRYRAGLPPKKTEDTMVTRKPSVTMRATAPTVRLVSTKTGKRIRLTSQKVVVGRSSECTLVLRASDISKRHCLIVIEPDDVTVEDLGSANGTFVNGQRIQRASLYHGDRLQIADHEFTVRFSETNEETA